MIFITIEYALIHKVIAQKYLKDFYNIKFSILSYSTPHDNHMWAYFYHFVIAIALCRPRQYNTVREGNIER